ncbi:centrosome-associated protein 350 isoform X2 [Erpetoichthys calabaricus]|uniref:centrosome-associated protein 350 isoform X2 n=1 Tax=Erpetoichthys calabaricus TaxID=27687 RepID=UPI002234C487|nr:centrosome-associated protein 350 isoform X2 [Erpetoichthys calabaricus]
MWSSKTGEASGLPLSSNSRRELASTWESLNQTKATLRHIENRLEVAPSSMAVLESIMDVKKTSSSSNRKVSRKDGRYHVDSASAAKPTGRGRAGKDKSSRSPLRVTTLESNVKKGHKVEFREPLASYRDAAPSYLMPSHLDDPCLLSDLHTTDTKQVDDRLSRMIYERDTRDLQSQDFESTLSTAVNDTVVQYLNDRPALDILRRSEALYKTTTGSWKAEKDFVAADDGSRVLYPNGCQVAVANSQSSSPSSSSQRLEILKNRQHDEKLEKLKERIRKQREHSEETTERERQMGYLEQPIPVNVETSAPNAKVRKVAVARPAPVYKGFNPTETKIRTPDGKVWPEAEFQNLSREIYRDLSLQLAGSHGINTASWREGQKVVRMVLGPPPTTAGTKRAQSNERAAPATGNRTGSTLKTESDKCLEKTKKPRARSAEGRQPEVNLKKSTSSTELPSGPEEKPHTSKDFLSVEIRSILDDLHLDNPIGEAEDKQSGVTDRMARGSRLSRSASPAKRKQESNEAGLKKRHYDSDSVRQYIVRQQEERKKRQSEEKRAQKEEAERKNKRLQELYKKQKEAFAKSKLTPHAAAQKRLQETYTKLLEQTKLKDQLPTVSEVQAKPMYQPSGESDKENKVQERPLSASSSSDLSLSEPQQPLTRNDLKGPSWMQPDRLSPSERNITSPTPQSGSLFTQLLGLDQQSLLQKEFESVLSRQRKEPPSVGIPYSSLSSNVLPKSAGQNKSRSHRIEALKATAASLSSRIENEARKLAQTSIACNSVCAAEKAVTPFSNNDGCWAKSESPPVRENSEEDLSSRIERYLNTGQTVFEGDLPGVGNLYEFKKRKDTDRSPVPEGLVPATVSVVEKQTKSSPEPVVASSKVQLEPHESSLDSISEGTLLSEGTLSEEEEPAHLQSPLKLAERLEERDFCAAEQTLFQPITDFKKEAEKFPTFTTQLAEADWKGPWEELKGSPHSVINIFTRNFQSCSKVLEEKGEKVQSRSLLSAGTPAEVSYEDDFVSTNSSSSHSVKRASSNGSVSSFHEELTSRKSPSDQKVLRSVDHSPKSDVASSPRSASSLKKDHVEDSNLQHSLDDDKAISSMSHFEATPGKQWSPPSKTSPHRTDRGLESDSSLGDLSPRSIHSVKSDAGLSKRSAVLSPSRSPVSSAGSLKSSQGSEAIAGPSGSKMGVATPLDTRFRPSVPSAFTDLNKDSAPPGFMQFSPAVLQHRMSAELSYLDVIEESVRQLSDMERVRGISMAQQETVSLAQILKAQQQRHERDFSLLKMKAEQEALDAQRQLEETRQKAAQVHVESQQSFAQARQEAAEALQNNASQMLTQQIEAVRYTADAARHIKEMTDLARSQIASAISVPHMPITALYDQQRQQQSEFIKELRSRSIQDRKNEASTTLVSKDNLAAKSHHTASFDSYSESSAAKNRDASSLSGASSSSSSSSKRDGSPLPSLERKKKSSPKETKSISIEEEVNTAADDSLRSGSIPSLPDEKDNASVATEYSLKFDESMTEDEIEEKSFRSLLPSESHRRSTLEKKNKPHDDSDDEHPRSLSSHCSVKDSSMPFSGGQDSFFKFTMEMVRQYMKEEEVRAHHQSSLLRLREKALKEKTKAELAWLELQKKRLRDKGEDDKMPPIRKRKRGLLLRLQQEQAEIKRLKEANKAARKERQLILKQQEEIKRMRQTTIKLQEKLKCAGNDVLELPSSDTVEDAAKLSSAPEGMESPSAVSASESETSSIMQKLKKMRSHMDEKHCSPVHYFFSVFTSHHWASLSVCFPNLHPKFQQFIYNQLVRFLTKREQKLMQRRRNAEELLEWRRRLDLEEAAIRRMEKQALAAWDREPSRQKKSPEKREDSSPERKEAASEEESSVRVPSQSSVHSDSSVPEEVCSLPAENTAASEVASYTKEQDELAYSQDFEPSSSPSKQTAPSKSSTAVRPDVGAKSSSAPASTPRTWTEEPQSVFQSETASDQSDIEIRINALKDELRKRKSIVDQLKKEQRKRQKERLKAQEASLLKKLESYNDFIQKTQEELGKEKDALAASKPQIKTPSMGAETTKMKTPSVHWPESIKNSSLLPDSEAPRSLPEDTAEQGVTRSRSPESPRSPNELEPAAPDHVDPQPHDASHRAFSPDYKERAEDELGLNSSRSLILEELKSEESEDMDSHNLPSLKLEDLRTTGVKSVTPPREPVSETDALSALEAEHNDLEGDESEVQGRVKTDDGPARERPLEDSQPEPEAPSDLPRTEEREEDFQSDASTKTRDTGDSASKGPGKAPCLEESNESYRDDFELSSASENLKNSWTRSSAKLDHRTVSLEQEDSTEEIGEELSDKSYSTHSSFRSERLLELKSPTEDDKNKERHDGEIERHSPEPSAAENPDLLPDFHVGDRVLVSSVQPGTLRFKGKTGFANGFWVGVELDKSEGSNNGMYDGVRYFECAERHGIFAPPHKISRLPDHFEAYVDTTEDEESLDERSKAIDEPDQGVWDRKEDEKELKPPLDELPAQDLKPSAGDASPESSNVQEMGKPVGLEAEMVADQTCQAAQKSKPEFATQGVSGLHDGNGPAIVEVEDMTRQEKQPTPLLDLLNREKECLEAQRKPSLFESLLEQEAIRPAGQQAGDKVGEMADKIISKFVSDAVWQMQQIRKAQVEKIRVANAEGDHLPDESAPRLPPRQPLSRDVLKDVVPRLMGKEELEEKDGSTSPDLCLRPESPVFGTNGQEELAKRLAELELGRDLLDALGDDQDWFDEDFGLSSRKEQQKRQQAGTAVKEPQKSLARPQLPLLKPRDEPLVVVPHTSAEVDKLVRCAVDELWKCKLSGRRVEEACAPAHYLASDAVGHDSDSRSRLSYKLVVFDLSREIFQEIFAECLGVSRPLWMKSARQPLPYYRRVTNPNNPEEVKDFISAEVQKLIGLKEEQKTDWQKLLKFGRKKRDRIDQILVQELPEEESQWVNYDEYELFVKMQLTDTVFDVLLKDTVDVLQKIESKRAALCLS